MKFEWINKLKKILKHNESITATSKKNLDYVDLAPIDNLPDDSEYFTALNQAFENNKVKNIAISGPYGSGKSSIIETYLKKNPTVKKRAINISMASFENEVEIEEKSLSMDLLEKSVLKQLFYKVDHSQIPQSRYRKLYKISIWKVFSYLLVLIILSAFFIYIFAPDIIRFISDKITDTGNRYNSSFISWIVFIVALMASIFMVSKLLFQLLSNAQIKEIKLPADTKVESKVDPDTIFNKNLDEIMYFFEATKYSYVFFEDLDRFNNIDIFIKLRELNTLLNNYDNIRKRKIIRFIYAVRDDIFLNEERTKFFDFIIPVIPVMNSTNATDVLIDKLKIKENGKDKQEHNISQEYILDVAPYITDMRILQNIYNEFILYKRTLRNGQDLNLKDEEMMSLIIFKNLYPKDFSDLQGETGIVKEAFDIINQKKTQVIEALKSKIYSYEQLLENADNEILKEKQEIKISMMSALSEWNGQAYKIRIGDYHNRTDYNIATIMDESFDINSFDSNKPISVEYRTWNGNTDSGNVRKEILEEYQKRWNNIHNVKKGDIIKSIEENKVKIIEIKGYSLKELIDQFEIEKILPDDVKENTLLVFMLRRGYINEKYANYINYFKGVSLTKDDMNFILSVKDNKPFSYEYHLTETDMIVSRLQEFEFRSNAIYNYDLLESLLASNKNVRKLETFISQLSNDSEESWDFIDGFIDNCKDKEKFIKLLAHSWINMWEYIYINSKLSYERKILYFKLIIAYAELEDLYDQEEKSSWNEECSNGIGLISQFMVEHSDILQKMLEKTHENALTNERIKEVIEYLEIEFKELSYDNVDADVIDFIFENNHYEINSCMVREIVKYKDSSLLDELDVKNYSTIRKLNYDPILYNIHNNFDIYMNSVFFDEKNIHEDIDTIIILIEESIEDNEMINHIINHEEFCVTSISDFCGNLIDDKPECIKLIWDQLFKEDKVVADWKNINTYYNKFRFTSELKEYISSKCDKIIRTENDAVNDELKKEIIISDINDTIFRKIIDSLEVHGNIPSFEMIPENKMKILIENKSVLFSSSNYDIIAETHPKLKSEFLVINQNEYINCIDDITMDSVLLFDLVNHKNCSYNLKQKLIIRFAVVFMSDTLAQIILDNNYQIDRNVFLKMWEVLDENNQNKLLLNNFEILNCDDLERCFKGLNKRYPGFSDRTRRHDVKIKYSNETIKLVKYLDHIDYITSYNIQGTNKEYDIQKLINDKLETRIIVCKIKSMPQSNKRSIVAN